LSHEACTGSTLLVNLDIDKLRHCEICARVQIDHNTYDHSQYVTLAHDASQYIRQFSDERYALLSRLQVQCGQFNAGRTGRSCTQDPIVQQELRELAVPPCQLY
jgi:hypothetical protein